jgi:hypothetical protein
LHGGIFKDRLSLREDRGAYALVVHCLCANAGRVHRAAAVSSFGV